MSIIVPEGIRSPADERKLFESADRTRRDVERLFSKPEFVPEVWWANAADRIALEITLTSGQISGLSNARPQQSRVNTGVNISSTSYVSAAGGPSFSGLSAGVYILQFGCNFNSNGGGDGLISASVNGTTASDENASEAQAAVDEYRFTLMTAVSLDLTEDSNSVELQYRVRSGDGNFYRRWAILQRVSNL